jgi:hypothetical protein
MKANLEADFARNKEEVWRAKNWDPNKYFPGNNGTTAANK